MQQILIFDAVYDRLLPIVNRRLRRYDTLIQNMHIACIKFICAPFLEFPGQGKEYVATFLALFDSYPLVDYSNLKH